MLTFYNAFNLEHRSVPRAEPPQSQAFMLVPQSSVPLLTIDGLIAWFVSGILADPSRQFAAMNAILGAVQLRHPRAQTRLPRSVPRSAFPERPDQAAVAALGARQQALAGMAFGQASHMQTQGQAGLQIAGKLHGWPPVDEKRGW
jgi:hypothetical protein